MDMKRKKKNIANIINRMNTKNDTKSTSMVVMMITDINTNTKVGHSMIELWKKYLVMDFLVRLLFGQKIKSQNRFVLSEVTQ